MLNYIRSCRRRVCEELKVLRFAWAEGVSYLERCFSRTCPLFRLLEKNMQDMVCGWTLLGDGLPRKKVFVSRGNNMGDLRTRVSAQEADALANKLKVCVVPGISDGSTRPRCQHAATVRRRLKICVYLDQIPASSQPLLSNR